MFEDTIDREVDWDGQQVKEQARWRALLQKREGLA
jgi:hypothetical protein